MSFLDAWISAFVTIGGIWLVYFIFRNVWVMAFDIVGAVVLAAIVGLALLVANSLFNV